MAIRLSDLDFVVPDELIAQAPLPDRESARLLVLPRDGSPLGHRQVSDLPELVDEGTLIVVNDTRVWKARLRGRRSSGGAVELLLVRREEPGVWSALGNASKPLRPGTRISFGDDLQGTIHGRDADGLLLVRLEIRPGEDEAQVLDRHGEVPLPPYIHRRPDESDLARYQTVFADAPGAVAAPTAGLHLTRPLLARLAQRGTDVRRITLHVGPGTFAPIFDDDVERHPMHVERYCVPEATARAVGEARRRGRPVLAVGTTVVRALESAVQPDGELRAGWAETRLLLLPGDRFRVVDQLLTNFHVPRSTLVALVMAFAGRDRILHAYAEAMRLRYRFFSYGDAMLIR